MSGSLPFGFGMPDDGAGRPAFDMGQLGAMLQHLGRLLESGGDGAVNWDLARDTARQAISAAGDPSVSEAERRALRGNRMGARFANGAFVARHGSWNRRPMAGYDVVFVGFDALGNALAQPPVPVLTGFLNSDENARGRPTWVAFASDGALLVSDDTGGVIWRVIDPAAKPAPAITPLPKRVAPPQPKGTGRFIMRPNADSDLLKPKP